MQALLMAKPCNVGLGEPDRKVGRFGIVAPTEDLAVPINPCQCLAIGQRDVQPNGADFAFEPAIDQRGHFGQGSGRARTWPVVHGLARPVPASSSRDAAAMARLACSRSMPEVSTRASR